MSARALAAALGALALAGLAHGVQGGPQAGLEAARARWEALDPARRAQLERRFEELRSMDPGRRRLLEERLEQLRGAESEALEELPEPAREELEGLAPAERREVVRELAHDALVERSRRVRESLPPPTRQRLDGAGPEDLREFVRERKQARRQDARLERALDELGRELDSSGQARERSRGRSPEEREAELIELHRRLLDRRVERGGLPPWIEPGEWEDWRQLRGRAFFERVERRRRERGAHGIEAVRGPRGPGAGPPRGAPDPDRTGDPARGAEVGRVLELLRPDPAWRIELHGLDPEQRRAAISARVEQRVLAALDARPGLVDPEALEELRGLHGRAFGEALRRQLADRRTR